MNFLESLLYGCISGITEFLPISSAAHQQILQQLLGFEGVSPLLNLFVHIGLFLAVIVGCGSSIEQLRRGYHAQRYRKRTLKSGSNTLELRFVKNAIIPLLIVSFVLYQCVNLNGSLAWIALFSLPNCAIMLAESRMMRGNKTEQTVSTLDSIVVGGTGALFVLPGISRISVMLAAATACGIDREKGLNWVILLSVPALAFLLVIDILAVFTVNTAVFTGAILPSVFAGVCAFICGYFSILLIKTISAHGDRIGFAFYSLGVALFSLILYLMVV